MLSYDSARMRRFILLALAWLLFAPAVVAAEHRITSPEGGLAVVVSDGGGLHYRVEVGGQAVVVESALGLGFQDGTRLGPSAVITGMKTASHDGSWRNDFGNRRVVRDRWREARLGLSEPGGGAQSRTFGLIVRAYDDGVAFRYDLPKGSGASS
jgi:alpha-glucosidase